MTIQSDEETVNVPMSLVDNKRLSEVNYIGTNFYDGRTIYVSATVIAYSMMIMKLQTLRVMKATWMIPAKQ